LTNEPSFKDEARVGQQGTLTRIWAKRGTRPRIKRDRRFTWAYLFGAICPARGTGAALVMPTVSIECRLAQLAAAHCARQHRAPATSALRSGAMNKHLAEISQCVSVSAIALLILDGVVDETARREAARLSRMRPAKCPKVSLTYKDELYLENERGACPFRFRSSFAHVTELIACGDVFRPLRPLTRIISGNL
jgi:hypothetical protein